MKELWTEKYRPNTLTDYVFRDQAQREQVEGWVKSGAIPHLLFSGSPGVGKTTLARILIHELGIDPFDVMETYSSTARFILTCNYPNRVIPALHSRCQGFHIEKVDVTEFTARMATILVTESVEFDLDTLDSYVKATYPDLRKCINLCQMNTVDGRLNAPHGDEGGATSDYLLTAVDLFKRGKTREARTLLCQNVRSEDMEALFRWMYDNLDLWGTTPERQDQAIIIIRNSAANASLVADHEINLSATIVELCNIQ